MVLTLAIIKKDGILKWINLFMAKKNVFDEEYKLIKEQIFIDLKKIK